MRLRKIEDISREHVKEVLSTRKNGWADTAVTSETGGDVLEIVGAAILKAIDNSMDVAVNENGHLLLLGTCHETEIQKDVAYMETV